MIFFGYTTCPNLEVAETIAKECVTRGLAACANILPSMISVYVWDGDVTQDHEVVLILKTSESQVNRLKELVVELHPYDCPCFVSWPIVACHKPFEEWLSSNLRPNP